MRRSAATGEGVSDTPPAYARLPRSPRRSLGAVILTGLNLHPVKSTAIRPVDSAYVGRAGLRGDREWMVVDADGEALTARECRELFRIVASNAATTPGCGAGLRLSAPGHDDLELSRASSGAESRVTIFGKQPLPVLPAGSEADEWVRRVLGLADVRLMWCHRPAARSLDPDHSRTGDHAAFQDAYPVTLGSEASLRQLNDWMAEAAVERGDEPRPLPMARFRPNLVIDGVEPFAEDRWRRIRVGGVEFRVARGVARCVMTTVDPDELSSGKEPIRTLSRHRRWAGKTWFCAHLIPDGEGVVRLGDEVIVLESAAIR